ncbi:MAG: prepilin-type N-terminal cleavage/methylation domain-containing protein [Phycisphaerae bacterium]|nr:prepilin-type N-terminal cleavage/methylation domain-containing protein [Phycisphaerae bacterium]
MKGRMLQRGTKRGGFTLLELLVVIAIIALLISILLPSLEAARRQAKATACLSHLKGVASSSRVYEADDPNGWGIPCHPLMFRQNPANPTWIGAYEWGGKSGIGTPNWVPGRGAEEGLGSKYGTKAGFGPATRPMNDILYPGGFADAYGGDLLGKNFDRQIALEDTKLKLDNYRCPADDGPPRGAHCTDWIKMTETSSYDFFGNSFTANILWTRIVGQSEPVWSNSPMLRPISRVPNPSRTLYYEENIGRWAWACKREPKDCFELLQLTGIDPGPTKAVRGWHGKDWTYQRAFVDSHAESQTVIIPGTEDAEGYMEHYRAEVVYPEDADRQRANTCIIIRGNGWQKDTLPAEGIITGLSISSEGRPSYERCVSSE